MNTGRWWWTLFENNVVENLHKLFISRIIRNTILCVCMLRRKNEKNIQYYGHIYIYLFSLDFYAWRHWDTKVGKKKRSVSWRSRKKINRNITTSHLMDSVSRILKGKHSLTVCFSFLILSIFFLWTFREILFHFFFFVFIVYINDSSLEVR